MEKTDQRLSKSLQLNLKRLIGSALLSLAFLAMGLCTARAETINLISDEETEQLVAEIAQPLFKAANAPFNRNKLYLVNDPSLNAFVADGNNLFIHTGTIMAADTPGEVSGVIAHETGHIMGGHILRQKLKDQEMAEVSLASAILAGAAAAASGRGDAAMAVLLGSQSSALTHYTRYRTEEERSADDAAITLLNKTNQNPAGMLKFMKRISTQNSMNGYEETPYFRTHPVTSERITFFEAAVKQSSSPESNHLQEKFDRVKAKLYAFLNSPAATFNKYPQSNNSVAARYGRAIAYFKQLKFAQAQQELDRLIAEEPQNPYFHELKGQIYLETGKIKPAIAEYQKASQIMPRSALLQVNLAQALLEDAPTPAQLKTAIEVLNQAVHSRPNAEAWLLLSRAYGMNGNEAEASYAAAEFSLRIGAKDTAERQALAAQKLAQSAKLRLKIEDLLLRIKNLNEK